MHFTATTHTATITDYVFIFNLYRYHIYIYSVGDICRTSTYMHIALNTSHTCVGCSSELILWFRTIAKRFNHFRYVFQSICCRIDIFMWVFCHIRGSAKQTKYKTTTFWFGFCNVSLFELYTNDLNVSTFLYE